MATAAIDYLEVKNTTMTGSEVTYTVDANATSTVFKARTTDVLMRTVTSGSYYTIAAGETYEVTDKNLRGRVLFFTGTNLDVLESVVNKEYQN